MKLIAIILFAACMQVSAKGYTQTITLSRQNAPLTTVFNDIEKQSGYHFLFTYELVEKAGNVTIDLKNATLQQALDKCLQSKPLTYTIIEKTVVIKPKVEVPKDASATLSITVPPPIDVKGRIVNEKGEPVDGASVKVKGTNIGTTTDANGEFILKAVDANATLVFSGTNIETFETKVNGKTNFDLTAKIKITTGEEVIVNKGYYTEKQKLSTGNVSKVAAKDIEKQPIANPLEALQGRMSGVYIQQTSGVPGSGFNIEIRGLNSLRKIPGVNNGNVPLFIVDGVPVASSSLDGTTFIAGQIAPLLSPFNSINPADIESVEVLKDADATAIYGSRGANGVVLITTKKGKTGKTKVDINFYTGSGKVSNTMTLLNTAQYLEMRHEAFRNDNRTTIPSFAYDLNGGWDTTRYTDWQKALFGGSAKITNLQVGLSGGNQNTQFAIGGGYFKETTVFPGDFSDQKGSAHLTVNHSSENKKLTATAVVNYVADINNLPKADPTATALQLAPVAPALYDNNGLLNWANSSWNNPLSNFLQLYKGTTKNLIANTIIQYQVLSSLNVKVSMGYNDVRMNQTAINPIRAQNPSFNPKGSGNYSFHSFNNWIIEPQAEYSTSVYKGKLNVLIGSTFQQSVREAESFFGSGYTSDALLENLQAAPNLSASVFEYAKYRYNGFFARINYNWDNKYLINLTSRRDGSSRFGPGRQFANFGAAGIGWVFSNEDFFQKNLSALSYGKIRGSYGVTGNDQIPDYGFLNTYSSTDYPYNGTGGLSVTRLFNPDFGWETNKKIEAAIELGFFKDRIFITSSYYRNRSSNQLVGYPLSAVTGQTSLPFYNLPANVENKGWEFELQTQNFNTKNFKWTTSFNLTIPKNKLVDYPGIERSSYANTYQVGQSLYIRKVYHFLNVDPQTGVFTFEDVDRNGSISSPKDLQALKEVSRKYFGGLQNTVSYKGLQLDLFFQYVKQTGLNYLSFFAPTGTLNNQPDIVLNRWRKPGDITDIQKFTQSFITATGSAYSNAQISDKYISDASFIRLKNVSLSYQLPPRWLSKAKIQNCRVYLQGQNLFTITNYLGLDPETQSFQSIPPLRMFTAGIQLTL